MMPGWGFALAVVSAIAINGGFYLQHDAGAAAPALSLHRPFASLWSLVRSPRWLAGYLGGLAGWVVYVVALSLAPLSLVQAASAGGVGVLALLAWRVGGLRLTRAERLGTVLAIVGLVLLATTLGGADRSVHVPVGPLLIWICALVASAAVCAGPLAAQLRPGAGLGVAAGFLFAAGDIATKGALSPGDPRWLILLLLACHLGAFVALQLGFQRGSTMATAGPATLMLSVLPIAAGLFLFHDGLPSGASGVIRLTSFGAVVMGAVLLARPSAEATVART
jgi:drug/metabolite transporter (DMT)-like permease